MKMEEYLTPEQKKTIGLNKAQTKEPQLQKKKKRQERVDWVEIMGVRRDTY